MNKFLFKSVFLFIGIFEIFGIAIFSFENLVLTLKIFITILSLIIFAINISKNKKILFFSNTVKIFFVFCVSLVISLFVNFEDFSNISNYFPVIMISFAILTYINLDENIYFFFALIILFFSSSFAFIQIFNTSLFDRVFSNYLNQISNSNYHFKVGRITSVWKEAPRFATVLVALLPYLFLILKSRPIIIRIITSFVILSTFVLLFLTFTRIALLIGIFLFFYFFSTSKKTVLLILSIGVLVLIIINIMSFGFNINFYGAFDRVIEEDSYIMEYSSYGINRFSLIMQFLPHIFNSPLWGMGDSFLRYLPQGFSSVHNSFIQILISNGIFVFVTLLLMVYRLIEYIFTSIEKIGNELRKASAISSLSISVISFFHGVLLDYHILILFFIGFSTTFSIRENRVV